MEIDEKELIALVKLLDDPDEEISEMVEQRLLDLGTEVVGKLESAWEESFDANIQQRLETIIHRIQFAIVCKDLETWVTNGATDLIRGVLIINRYQYPDLKEQLIFNHLEEIKTEIWRQMSWDMTPFEKIRTFNHVFYHQFKFGGNTTNYQDPQNSYLNLVLETHKGNQISLAIIYSHIARSLGLPVYGVNLPQHFILAYSTYEGEGEIPKVGEGAVPNSFEGVIPNSGAREVAYENPVQFYINAFNKGLIFYQKEIDVFLKQLNLEKKLEYYQPCTNDAIVMRVIRNLIGSYEKLGSEEKVKELETLLSILH